MPRELEILFNLVHYFIEKGFPASSNILKKTYNLKWSTATIRNEMVRLEKQGFLEKNYLTSAKIPSKKAFQFYAENTTSKQHHNLFNELRDLLAKRWLSIDQTIDKAAELIAQMTNTTSVTSNHDYHELFVSITMTPISSEMGVIVIVTSKGRVEHKIIHFNKIVSIEDVKIAIKIFNHRLVATPLSEIGDKLLIISPILAKSVKNYEQIIQSFSQEIFTYDQKIHNNVYENKNIIQNKNISREKLSEIMEMLKSKSIWSSIESKFQDVQDEDRIKIKITDDNTAIFSKKIEMKNFSKELSIISSNRINYGKIKKAMAILISYVKKQETKE